MTHGREHTEISLQSYKVISMLPIRSQAPEIHLRHDPSLHTLQVEVRRFLRNTPHHGTGGACAGASAGFPARPGEGGAGAGIAVRQWSVSNGQHLTCRDSSQQTGLSVGFPGGSSMASELHLFRFLHILDGAPNVPESCSQPASVRTSTPNYSRIISRFHRPFPSRRPLGAIGKERL